MLKKIILKHSAEKHRLISKSRRLTDLNEASSAALLIDNVQNNLGSIQYLIGELAQLQITLRVYGFYKRNQTPNKEIVNTALRTSDFTWLGKDKTGGYQTLEDTKYDYLFCFQSTENIIFDSILSKSNARCRIGVSRALNDKGLLDLVLSPKKEKDLLDTIKEVLKYLHMIKSK